MPKRSSKKDANDLARSIVDQVADDVEPVEEAAEPGEESGGCRSRSVGWEEGRAGQGEEAIAEAAIRDR